MKESLWTLSNYAASGGEITEKMMEDNLLDSVAKVGYDYGIMENTIFCECMHVVLNLFTECSDQSFFEKCNNRLSLELIARTLNLGSSLDNGLIMKTLEGLERFLKID